MSATKPATFGVYPDRQSLERAVGQLKKEGFSPSEISVVVPQQTSDTPAASIGAKVGAGTGMVVGGALGLLIGAGILAFPGIGALIVAGPIGTAIAGSAVMGGVGGILGSLMGLGLSGDKARHYESRLKQGHPILFVQCEEPERSAMAQKIFVLTSAEDVFSPEFNSFSKP
jgi:hypothetical protein